MLKRNSIFIRVLVPVVIVMLIQTILISMVLFVNGTIESIEDSAIEAMRKNADNRGLALENMMVHKLSNLEKLENSLFTVFDAYLKEHDVSADDVLGEYEYETSLLYDMSEPLIDALRQTSSTGVYVYFLDDEDYSESIKTFNGLYYRDLDPVSTPADNSDILFLRGFVDIARKDKIQLDSLWSEVFSFSPDKDGVWTDYSKPLIAAAENKGLKAAELSYWNTPHLINPGTLVDSNECITYSRPLFYNGKLIAIIGVEMQTEQLTKNFPASDFDTSGKGGYMLIKYDAGAASGAEINCNIYAITGSYIKRQFGSKDTITLAAGNKENVYTVTGDDIEDYHVAVKPIRLYNENAPFSNEKWALASIGADSMLFEPSKSVIKGILYSCAVALFVGVILIAVIIRLSTKPLISIANQISVGDPEDPVIITDSNTYETALLCSTINAMKYKRLSIEAQLREERERYLVALESAADTFMEYDIARDSFMLYYFSHNYQKPELCSSVISSFTERINCGDICHQDDVLRLLRFLRAQITEPIEIRVETSVFPHINDTETDSGYYWMLLKASHIYNEGGVKKIIGIAREITQDKLKEDAMIEASRHDSTTGYYNRDYGMRLVNESVRYAKDVQVPFAICVFRINGFDTFEVHYGRVFCGVILMRLSRRMLSVMARSDVAVRLNNDEIMFFFSDARKGGIKSKIERICTDMAEMYTGEAPDMRLSLSAGAALSTVGTKEDLDSFLRKARAAAQYSQRSGGTDIAFYDELPRAAVNEGATSRENPVSISLDISKDTIVGLAFDLFEHTTDIKSVINVLLAVLGEMFALRQIVVCSYDADFGANQAEYQWNTVGVEPHHGNIEKISRDDFAAFEQMVDENGTMLFNSENIKGYSQGVGQLLCILPDEIADVFCCVMYGRGTHTGRILFKSQEQGREWTEHETHSLHEISKIISTHVSVEKSNSASRAKSEFLSRMSHEIRTPMNAIIGMTGIAKKSADDPARLGDCLNKIDFSAQHLLALINDVLEMSRIESGKLKIEYEPFSLASFVSDMDTLMRPQIENKNIKFLIYLKAEHDNIVSDGYRLRQVLVNFLGNSVKFTSDGGTITLSIEEQEATEPEFGVYRFSVKDTGSGIREEDQANIFKAFEQAESDGVGKKRHDGTGLGLAISSSIINEMGAKIELFSEPGIGSEFFFTLKIKYEEDKAQILQSESTEADYGECFAGKRILLAEDNEINIEIASYILDEAGFYVDTARNGQEAVDMFSASKHGYYDAILMDIHMPVMDGLTAAREIRKNANRPDSRIIPIIAMTADAFDDDMRKSVESGMNGHLAKPVDNEKLYELLKQLLCSTTGNDVSNSN